MSRASSTDAARVPVILALGSNVGDRRAHLSRGLELLGRHLQVRSVSRVVESEPWGPVRQRKFLNLVLRAETTRSPEELLDLLQRIERKAGRRREVHMGPRTLDVDIIFYGQERIRAARLQVPHPHWRDRPFVADLLIDVVGDMVDPVSGRSLRELVPRGPLSPELRVVEDLESPSSLVAPGSS